MLFKGSIRVKIGVKGVTLINWLLKGASIYGSISIAANLFRFWVFN